jgi:hypothetical protein
MRSNEQKEFWKITEAKKHLLNLIKENKLSCNVTRSEESDTKTKIKLMQEAEKYGREQALKEFKVKKIVGNCELKQK